MSSAQAQLISNRLNNFESQHPRTLKAALELLEWHGDKAVLMAGGSDLLCMMKYGAIDPAQVISLKGIEDLSYIREGESGQLHIGAMTRVASLLRSDLLRQRYTALWESARDFATPQVRNSATLGGNICRSSPLGDSLPSLLAFDASVSLIGRDGQRTLPLDQFLIGPGKNSLQQEILTEITLNLPEGHCGSAYSKLVRNSSDLAKVNCAVTLSRVDGRCRDIRIALGAVAPTVVRARAVEEALQGKTLSDESIAAAAIFVCNDIQPISDVRASARYRTIGAEALIKRLIKSALARTA